MQGLGSTEGPTPEGRHCSLCLGKAMKATLQVSGEGNVGGKWGNRIQAEELPRAKAWKCDVICIKAGGLKRPPQGGLPVFPVPAARGSEGDWGARGLQEPACPLSITGSQHRRGERSPRPPSGGSQVWEGGANWFLGSTSEPSLLNCSGQGSFICKSVLPTFICETNYRAFCTTITGVKTSQFRLVNFSSN